MKPTIIGAGIGGLTTAIALRQKGFEVEVFESFPSFKPLGSGINLANNAMQIYRELGLYETIMAQGNPVSSMNVLNDQFEVLSSVDLKPFEEQYGVSNVAIHRSVLQRILLDHLPEGTVRLGKRLKHMEDRGKAVQLIFEDDIEHEASIVIGADGIHSVVRASIFGRKDLRDAGQLCWRGITPFELPERYRHGLFELWGKGKRFGFVNIGEDKVYWYALRDDEDAIGLGELFVDFHPLVGQIINSTPHEKILENQMADFEPISSWHKGRICLVGDAAHATTPNLGQGACQAVESAWVLAESLSKNKNDFSDAFNEYENLRKKKAHQVTSTSWQLGKVAHWKNSLLVGLRNKLMQWTPQSIGQRQSAAMFKVPGLS